jgi:hypothetical protein
MYSVSHRKVLEDIVCKCEEQGGSEVATRQRSSQFRWFHTGLTGEGKLKRKMHRQGRGNSNMFTDDSK